MKKTIKITEAFQTSDGELFTDKSLAEEHQKDIELTQNIRKFADKYGSYTDGKEDLYEALIENVDELKKILNDE